MWIPWLTQWRLWPRLSCCDEEVLPENGHVPQLFVEKMISVFMGQSVSVLGREIVFFLLLFFASFLLCM